MGVSEKMAHTRLFTQIQLEFYVDNEYKTLKFLDHWMEFIANGSGQKQSGDGYYYRMEYPDDYKSNQTKIIKFDRDYKNEIEYTFYGMFPIDLSSTTVKYDTSEVLKATATFSFDRYIAGKFDSYSVNRGNDNNKQFENQKQFERRLDIETGGGQPDDLGLSGSGTTRELRDINSNIA